MYNIRCFLILAYANIRQGIIHSRKLFFTQIFCLSLSYITSFASVWVIMNKFQRIKGWDFSEIAFIYILSILSQGFSNLVFLPFRSIDSMVENGDIDKLLTKPLSPIVNIMGSNFQLMGFSNIFVAILLFAILKDQFNITWNFITIVYFIIALISATLVHGSILIIIGSFSFIFIRTQGLDDVYASLRDFGQYPITFYNTIVQIILTFIIPIAFISYIPGGIFLKNADYNIYPSYIWKVSLIFGFIFFAFANSFWNLSIKHYQSTGN